MHKNGFASLISLLLSLLIVGILCYFAFNSYFKKSPIGEGADISRPQTVIDKAKINVQNFNQETQERQRQLEQAR